MVRYDQRLRDNVVKPAVDDVMTAFQLDEGMEPKRSSRGSGSTPIPRVALDLATTVERIQNVRAARGRQSLHIRGTGGRKKGAHPGVSERGGRKETRGGGGAGRGHIERLCSWLVGWL